MGDGARSRLDKSQRELVRNILAASSTTAFCVAVMNPIDVLRIRWQTKPAALSHLSMSEFVAQQTSGPGFLRRIYLPGVGVNAASVATSSGLRLGLYPLTKDVVCKLVDAGEASSSIMFASGFLSGALGFLLATPFFTAKIQAQAFGADRSGWSCLVSTCTQSNPFRGSSILVARGALFSAGFSLGYDGTKTRLRKRNVAEGPLVHAAASVVAAVASTGLAAPFDSMLTRFQTSPSGTGLARCAQTIYQDHGPRGFFRGWSLFFARVAPLFVVQLPLYEQARRLLGMDFM